jgi:ArsR family transcriptional regulator
MTTGTTRKSLPADHEPCCLSLSQGPLSETESTQLATILSAMADPVRLRLLSIIATTDEVCSCHLEAPLGRSQPTISHHTRVLAEAGLIEGKKLGKWTLWRIVPERLATVRQFLGGP